MNTAALRELIQQAHLSEARHGHLADLIASCLPRPVSYTHLTLPTNREEQNSEVAVS